MSTAFEGASYDTCCLIQTQMVSKSQKMSLKSCAMFDFQTQMLKLYSLNMPALWFRNPTLSITICSNQKAKNNTN